MRPPRIVGRSGLSRGTMNGTDKANSNDLSGGLKKRNQNMRIVVLLVLISVIGCNIHEQKIEVQEVKKAEKFTVICERTNMGGGFNLVVAGSGWIDGEAELTLLDNDGVTFRSRHMTGEVNFNWSQHWTAGSAHMVYEPIDVSGGSLSLVCEFKEK